MSSEQKIVKAEKGTPSDNAEGDVVRFTYATGETTFLRAFSFDPVGGDIVGEIKNGRLILILTLLDALGSAKDSPEREAGATVSEWTKIYQAEEN